MTKDYIALTETVDSSASFKVYKGELSEKNVHTATPILGSIISKKESSRFTPLIPFTFNQKYTVVYNGVVDYFEINPPKDYERLSIEAIYPSSRKLPSNVLKWYIRFSKSIDQTNPYDHIHFLTASGDTIRKAILNLENALISEDRKLLTVWIDPGRQKRGLIPNQQLGAVFEEGKEYSLVITQEFKDKEGIPLKQNQIHQFIITTSDRKQPNVNSWKIRSPEVGTISELKIDFKEQMDYGSMLNRITLLNPDKKKVTGDLKLIKNESTLVLKPHKPWIKGEYEIVIDSRIEDLAGNNLNRLFDTKIVDETSKDIDKAFYSLFFSIK
ncbi:Ig-like domain-containing protein [Aquimarina gracilis]|uniref:Ig-like domain-containing protein n=1 Tax=Aquimarina gracilis TaxID=874422 RepID=A0ABU5ZX95_9FLAO|nr:Ig-like domain-containing protein [Aquimarina gracilis]MEB3346499.1 Ig-like domain-containing protein [Aquimarina gracilis]